MADGSRDDQWCSSAASPMASTCGTTRSLTLFATISASLVSLSRWRSASSSPSCRGVRRTPVHAPRNGCRWEGPGRSSELDRPSAIYRSNRPGPTVSRAPATSSRGSFLSRSQTVFRRTSMGLVISAMLICALLWVRWATLDGGNWIDFDVYVQGGLAILRGESLYGLRVDGLPFTYPPEALLRSTVWRVVRDPDLGQLAAEGGPPLT